MEKVPLECLLVLAGLTRSGPGGENETLLRVGLVVYSLHLAVSTFPSKTAPSVDCHPGNANFSLWG